MANETRSVTASALAASQTTLPSGVFHNDRKVHFCSSEPGEEPGCPALRSSPALAAQVQVSLCGARGGGAWRALAQDDPEGIAVMTEKGPALCHSAFDPGPKPPYNMLGDNAPGRFSEWVNCATVTLDQEWQAPQRRLQGARSQALCAANRRASDRAFVWSTGHANTGERR
jgi:hypothetical protein